MLRHGWHHHPLSPARSTQTLFQHLADGMPTPLGQCSYSMVPQRSFFTSSAGRYIYSLPVCPDLIVSFHASPSGGRRYRLNSNLLHTARSQSDNSNLSNSHHGVMVRRIIHAMSLSILIQFLHPLHHHVHGLVRHGWASNTIADITLFAVSTSFWRSVTNRLGP